MAGPQTQGLERGRFDDRPAKVLIVVSPYYRDIADQLLQGARAEIEAWGAIHETAEVPGALEIPSAIAVAARLGQFHAFVALGCVIRGETGHYDIVAGESARALMDLGLVRRLPIGNGILTVETVEQAWARARVADMNKGGGAAAAALSVLRATAALAAARPAPATGFLAGAFARG